MDILSVISENPVLPNPVLPKTAVVSVTDLVEDLAVGFDGVDDGLVDGQQEGLDEVLAAVEGVALIHVE